MNFPLKNTGLFLVCSLLFSTANAALPFYILRQSAPLFGYMARTGFQVGKQFVQKAYPVAKECLENPAAKAAVQGVKVWAAENPKQAGGVALGAFVGYHTSGDGIIDTTIGTGLGAAAGLTIPLNAARLGLVKSPVIVEELVHLKNVVSSLEKTVLAQVQQNVVKKEVAKAVVSKRAQALQARLARKELLAAKQLEQASVVKAPEVSSNVNNLTTLFDAAKTKVDDFKKACVLFPALHFNRLA